MAVAEKEVYGARLTRSIMEGSEIKQDRSVGLAPALAQKSLVNSLD